MRLRDLINIVIILCSNHATLHKVESIVTFSKLDVAARNESHPGNVM